MEEIITGTGTRERIGLQYFAEETGSAEPAGENGQESAEPAPDGTAGQGEKEQGAAESAPQYEQQQSQQDNAAFAAARRRAEAQMQERLRAEKDALVRQMLDGQTNPYTGRPFAGVQDWEEYQRQYQSDVQKQQLERAGLDEGVLNQMIEQNPVVQQARQVIGRVQQEEGQRALSEQIAEIAKLDPAVTGFEALTRHENFEQFDALVRQGYPLVDAFKLANYDRLTGKKAAAARQAALNSVNGKSHLGATRGADGGDDIVPDETELSMMRHAFPDKTHDEIVALIKKYRN